MGVELVLHFNNIILRVQSSIKMEGSVKSLIEAEEEAHKIVQQAEKEKTEKVKDAH